SYGGMPATQALEIIPEGTITSLLYLDAFCPDDGDCLNELTAFPAHVPENPDDYLVDPPRLILQGFNSHMTDDDRSSYEHRRTPQSGYCFSDRVQLTGGVRRSRRELTWWRLATRTIRSFQSRSDCVRTARGGLRKCLSPMTCNMLP